MEKDDQEQKGRDQKVKKSIYKEFYHTERIMTKLN